MPSLILFSFTFSPKKHQEHLSLITILNVIQIPELVGVSTEAKMIENEAITLVSVMKTVLQKLKVALTTEEMTVETLLVLNVLFIHLWL